MVALAASTDSALRACDAEVGTPGPSYTIDTIDFVASRRAAHDTALVFVTGADAFLEIRTWHRWRELLDRCHFAVVTRRGLPAATLRASLPALSSRMVDAAGQLPGHPAILLIDGDTAAVSSTELRRALAAGRPPPGLLPGAVAEYAVRHGLYAGPQGRETSKG
jgi:nicotinate-nucleotide adenylyltransferase